MRSVLFVAKVVQSLLYWPVFLLLRLVLNYRVEGQEHLLGYEDQPLIFAANHTSFVDGLIAAAAMPRTGFTPWQFFPMRFLVIKRFMDLWNIRAPFAIFNRLIGCISVRPAHGDYDVALGEAVRAIKAGHKVWIFPEGKFTPNGRVQRGRRGIAHLAKETGVAVVPVYIDGAFGVLSDGHFWKRGTKIVARIGKPVCFVKNADRQAVVDQVMDEIQYLSFPIRHEIPPVIKVLAVHGFWRRGQFWRELSPAFRARGLQVIAPNIEWSREPLKQLLAAIEEEKPDVVIGMSLGGYLTQQALEFISPEKVGLCVLIAPVGPHGLGFNTFVKLIGKMRDKEQDGRDRDFYDDNPIYAWYALPFCGSVWSPILAPTLVVSGGKDKFVSVRDADKTAIFHRARHVTYPSLSHSELAKDEKVIQDILRWIDLETEKLKKK